MTAPLSFCLGGPLHLRASYTPWRQKARPCGLPSRFSGLFLGMTAPAASGAPGCHPTCPSAEAARCTFGPGHPTPPGGKKRGPVPARGCRAAEGLRRLGGVWGVPGRHSGLPLPPPSVTPSGSAAPAASFRRHWRHFGSGYRHARGPRAPKRHWLRHPARYTLSAGAPAGAHNLATTGAGQ